MAEANPSGPTPGAPQPAAKGASGATGASGASGASSSSTTNDPPEVGTEVAAVLAAYPPAAWSVLIAFVIIAAGTVAAYFLWKGWKPSDFMPSSNYAVYAGLFIMALALERLLEPFSGLFIPSANKQKVTSVATKAHAKRITQAHVMAASLHAAAAEAPSAHQVALAQTKATVETKKAHVLQSKRAVLMWAAATVLAMLACAALGIFLLRSVESTTSTGTAAKTTKGHASAPTPAKDPNRVLDLLATGLVVGAGTKPLHDLITQIQTSSSNAKSSGNSSTAA